MPALYESDTTESMRERAVTYVCALCSRAKAPHAVRQLVFSVHSVSTTTYGITGVRSRSVQTWTREGRSESYPHALLCECGRHMEARPVSGHYSADHKCGARCRNAKSGDCECECGGANHGKGFQ